LARIAARQYGLVTSVQIARVGLGRPAVANRVKDGRLHPLYRGVYAVGHGRLSREGRWLAAVLAAGDGAVLSHLAAAVHWKIWRRRWDGIDVTVPGQRRSRAGFRVHRCRNLDPRDTTRYQGIPITTPARTLVDLADTLTSHQLANVIHEAAFRNRFDETRTREAMQRAQGRPLNTLHVALHAHAAGSAGTRSDLEDRFLEAWTGPEPRVNTKVHGIEVDLYWPDDDLVVEIDGSGHARPRTRTEDARRDEALRENGMTIVRLPSADG
jgi:hypothetical protein